MKKLFLFLLSLTPFTAACGNPLEIGAKAPALEAIDHDGNKVSLAEAYAKGLVLVFFYPRADTPGCTAQACSLRDFYAPLKDKGVTIFGVSTDSPKAQKAFKEKHNLPFSLLADTEAKVIEGFGVPRRANFASRQAFLIKDGVVIWRDLRASTAKQAEDVMAALKELGL